MPCGGQTSPRVRIPPSPLIRWNEALGATPGERCRLSFGTILTRGPSETASGLLPHRPGASGASAEGGPEREVEEQLPLALLDLAAEHFGPRPAGPGLFAQVDEPERVPRGLPAQPGDGRVFRRGGGQLRGGQP